MQSISSDVYGGADLGPGSIVRLVLESVVPHRLDDARWAELLSAESGRLATVVEEATRPGSKGSSTSPWVAAADASATRAQASAAAAQFAAVRAASPAAAAPPSLSLSMSASSSVAPSQPSPRATASVKSTDVSNQRTTVSLADFLSSLRLDVYAAALRNLGVESIEDLAEIRPEDFDQIGMRELHRRRLMDAVGRWKLSVPARQHTGAPTATPDSAPSPHSPGGHHVWHVSLMRRRHGLFFSISTYLAPYDIPRPPTFRNMPRLTVTSTITTTPRMLLNGRSQRRAEESLSTHLQPRQQNLTLSRQCT